MNDERIEEVAAGPAKASSEIGSFEEQKISDLIEAQRHLTSTEAVTKPHRGMRLTKLVPPGGR